MTDKPTTSPPVDLQEVVAEADTGGRKPTSVTTAKAITAIAVTWSLFQL